MLKQKLQSEQFLIFSIRKKKNSSQENFVLLFSLAIKYTMIKKIHNKWGLRLIKSANFPELTTLYSSGIFKLVLTKQMLFSYTMPHNIIYFKYFLEFPKNIFFSKTEKNNRENFLEFYILKCKNTWKERNRNRKKYFWILSLKFFSEIIFGQCINRTFPSWNTFWI